LVALGAFIAACALLAWLWPRRELREREPAPVPASATTGAAHG
jgi:HAMP domain-containing protein